MKTKINISKNVVKWNHTKNKEQSSYRLDKDRRLRRQLTLAMKRAREIWFFTEMKRSGGSPRPDWRHKQRTHGALSGVATNSDSPKHNSNQGQRTLVFHDTTWEPYLRQLHSSIATTSEVYLNSTPDFWSSIPTPGVSLAPSLLLMEQIEIMKRWICGQYIKCQ